MHFFLEILGENPFPCSIWFLQKLDLGDSALDSNMCGGRGFLKHQAILWTPAGCPTIQSSSGTVHPETASDEQVKGSVLPDRTSPPLQMRHEPRLSPARL